MSDLSAQDLSGANFTITTKWLWHSTQVYCLSFDKSGKFVITGGDDGVLNVYSLANDKLVQRLTDEDFEEFTEAVNSVCRTVEPNVDTLERQLERFAINDIAVEDQNVLVAAAKNSGSISVWNLQTFAFVVKFEEQVFPIRTLLFSSSAFDNYKYLVSTSEDGFVFLYEYNYKTLVFKKKSVYRKGKYDGQRAHNIAVDTSSGGVLFGSVYTLGLVSPSAKPKSKKEPFVKSRVQSAIRICSLSDELGLKEEWKTASLKTHTDCVYSFRFSNTSFRFANACDSDPNVLIWSFDRANKKWDSIIIDISATTGSKKLLRGKSKQLLENTVFVDELIFSVDDKYLITVLTDISVKVWNSESGELIHHFANYHSKKISVIERHPILSNVFLSAGYDSKIFIYDITKGVAIRRFDCNFKSSAIQLESQSTATTDRLNCQLLQCCFSPDGQTIAATDDKGNLTVFAMECRQKCEDSYEQLEKFLEKMHGIKESTKESKDEPIELSDEYASLMQSVAEYESDLLKGIDRSSPLKNKLNIRNKSPKRVPTKIESNGDQTQVKQVPKEKEMKDQIKANPTKNKTLSKKSIDKTPTKENKEKAANETKSMDPEKISPKSKSVNTKQTFSKILDEIFDNEDSVPFRNNDEIRFPTFRKEISDADLCLTSIKEDMLFDPRYTLTRFNKNVNKVIENAKSFYKHKDKEIFAKALALEKFYCDKMLTHFGVSFKPPLRCESSDEEESGESESECDKPSTSEQSVPTEQSKKSYSSSSDENENLKEETIPTQNHSIESSNKSEINGKSAKIMKKSNESTAERIRGKRVSESEVKSYPEKRIKSLKSSDSKKSVPPKPDESLMHVI